jgi:hypothetical protein
VAAVVVVGLSVAVVVAAVLRAAPTTTLLRLLHNAARSTIVADVGLTMVRARQALVLPLPVPVVVAAVVATRIGIRAGEVKTTGTSDHRPSVHAMNVAFVVVKARSCSHTWTGLPW